MRTEIVKQDKQSNSTVIFTANLLQKQQELFIGFAVCICAIEFIILQIICGYEMTDAMFSIIGSSQPDSVLTATPVLTSTWPYFNRTKLIDTYNLC